MAHWRVSFPATPDLLLSASRPGRGKGRGSSLCCYSYLCDPPGLGLAKQFPHQRMLERLLRVVCHPELFQGTPGFL